ATGVKAAKTVMSDLVQRVQLALGEFDWPVGLSAGAVTFLVVPTDVDEMVDLADGLMYEAKRAGKGTFRHLVVGASEPEALPEEAPSRASGQPSGRGLQTS
ncbi:MAG: GGDEF domain-containing protein, partial [Actinomycetota bacterium]|nr:GGDEF domain-containing protein [Actinomycetota bacterium]